MAPADTVAADRAAWTPTEGVVHFNGEPVRTDVVYFEAPPAEIGAILAAGSTLAPDKKPTSSAQKWGWSIGIFVVIVLFAEFALVGNARGPDKNVIRVVAMLFGIAIGGFVASRMRFKHTCSYVGELGIARYTLVGRLDAESRREVFEFKNAADLKTGQTRHFYNGIYTGTTYHHHWSDYEGRVAFTFKGQFKSKEGTPKASDPYWFARAAELAWNSFIAEAMQSELDELGFVQFNVNKNDWVRVGSGFMEFCFGGNTNRVEAKDIKSLSINQGSFSITTHDARWFGSKGKFRFDYSRLSNAQMFLVALEKLMGYQFN